MPQPTTDDIRDLLAQPTGPRQDAQGPAWQDLTSDPALDPQAWGLDEITTAPGSITLHHRHGTTWTISGFTHPREVIAFMLTGDHEPGSLTTPNDYELLTGHTLTWTRS